MVINGKNQISMVFSVVLIAGLLLAGSAQAGIFESIQALVRETTENTMRGHTRFVNGFMRFAQQNKREIAIICAVYGAYLLTMQTLNTLLILKSHQRQQQQYDHQANGNQIPQQGSQNDPQELT